MNPGQDVGIQEREKGQLRADGASESCELEGTSFVKFCSKKGAFLANLSIR